MTQSTNEPANEPVAVTPPMAIPLPQPQGDATGGVIPYKNVPALVGYYLGVFGIVIPLMGIAALVLGIAGLVKVSRQPEVRGTAHSIVAIVLGGLFGLGWLLVILVFVGAFAVGR